jgi:putative nucleotidyltransferase with HDIG domain
MINPHFRLNHAEFAGLVTLIRSKSELMIDYAQKDRLESVLGEIASQCDCTNREKLLNKVMTDRGMLKNLLTLYSGEKQTAPTANTHLEISEPTFAEQLIEEPVWNGQCGSTQQPCSLAFLLSYLLGISNDKSVSVRDLKGQWEDLPPRALGEGDLKLELTNNTGEVLNLLVNAKRLQEMPIQALNTKQLQSRCDHIRLVESDLATLFQEEKKRVLQLGQLQKLSKELVGIYDPQRVKELAVEKVRDLAGFSTCAILSVVDREDKKVRVIAKSGFPDHFFLKDDPLMHISVVDEIIQTKKPVYFNLDDLQAPRFLKKMLMAKVQSICAYPILINDSVDSIIVFGREETTLTGLLTDHVAIAIENAQLFEEIHLSFQRLASLRSIDQAISNNRNLDSILEILINHVLQQLKVDAACVMIFNKDRETLQFRWGKGFAYKKYSGKEFAVNTTIAEQAIRVNHTVCYPSIDLRNYSHLNRENFTSVACTPIFIQGKVEGVLEVFSKEPLRTSLDWIEFFETLAWQIAITIDNYDLFNGLQRSNQDLVDAYDATIQGWSHALDLRDKETEGHTQRVTEKALSLARKMNYPEEALVHMRRGALLHDIGKMSIPDRILLKEGPLTDEEWVIMRKHTDFAFELMAPIQYLWPALDIPYCHHEKWDGSGYPRGLKGEEIPLAARIFSVVDVWDALTSDRPYRKAWTHEAAITFIRSQRGKHFDPRVVDVFLENFSDCV